MNKALSPNGTMAPEAVKPSARGSSDVAEAMKYDRQFREGAVQIQHATGVEPTTGKPIADRPGHAPQRTKYWLAQTITRVLLGASVSWFCPESTV